MYFLSYFFNLSIFPSPTFFSIEFWVSLAVPRIIPWGLLENDVQPILYPDLTNIWGFAPQLQKA